MAPRQANALTLAVTLTLAHAMSSAQAGTAAPHTPLAAAPNASQQVSPATAPQSSDRRTRLLLKDGSYQIVTGYRVDGNNVRYHSAERGGAEEVIPLNLVDLPATQRWEQRHLAQRPSEEGQERTPPPIDPELLKEEADRAALTPEVAPDLRLPEQDSLLALDTFQGTPELIPLPQSAGELNRSTAHNVVKGLINPLSSPHTVVQLRGVRAAIQVHVDEPDFYVRVGDDAGAPGGGSPLTVDTHGASGAAPTASAGGGSTSRYVIVRADVRTDARLLASFDLRGERRSSDVIATRQELLPGGHWAKVSPREPLLFGEYALIEVLNDREINLGVWDFGVHPVAPENRDALKPEAKRAVRLDRHSSDE